MTPTEQSSLLTIAWLAAFADGDKSDVERAQLRSIASTLASAGSTVDVQAVLQDVLLKRVSLAQAVAGLSTQEQRQLAFELAVTVCDADGAQSQAEQQFLSTLKAALGSGLDSGFAAQTAGLALLVDAPGTGAGTASPSAAMPTVSVDRTRLEKTITNQALLCGALELLPQSWASMAIIPLQLRLVHTIGTAHGAVLDASMVKEFAAAAGVGLTSQYLEQFGRKLLGGLLGRVAGGLGRGVGSAGAGVAMSFATTYALGQLALRYYAGGRQMSTALLRETYTDLLGNARQLQTTALPQIQERARTLDAGQVLQMVRQPLA